MITETDTHTTTDLLTAGNLVDQLAGLSVDQLRAWAGRLEDTHRVVRAILRERLALARRDVSWRASAQHQELTDHDDKDH